MSKIVFIGTSITKGVRPGVVDTDTFAYKVFVGRGFDQYVNVGLGNDTSQLMLARFDADVLGAQPTHVCIEIPHINDYFLTPTPILPFATEANVRAMIQKAHDACLKTTVINHQLVRNTPLNNDMQPRLDVSWRLGNIPGVVFVDCYQDFAWKFWQLGAGAAFDALYAMSGTTLDWQHPSALGHTAMANRILANPRACALA